MTLTLAIIIIVLCVIALALLYEIAGLKKDLKHLYFCLSNRDKTIRDLRASRPARNALGQFVSRDV